MKKQYIRTSFGATAQFGRRVDAFYQQIDWELGWVEPNERRQRSHTDTIRVWHKEQPVNTALRDVLNDLLVGEVL